MGWLARAAAAVAAPFVFFHAAGLSCAVESDAQRLPGEFFRNSSQCPEFVIAPSGEFDLGSQLFAAKLIRKAPPRGG